MTMRTVFILLVFCALAVAQAIPADLTPTPITEPPALPNHWAGAFASFNQDAQPQLSGGVTFAKRIAGATYSFSAVHITNIYREEAPQTLPNPSWFDRLPRYRLETSTETGIAQHLFRFGRAEVFAMATAGPVFAESATGTKLGAALNGGGFAQAPLGRGWTVGPVLRFGRTTTTGEWRWSVGLLAGWGE